MERSCPVCPFYILNSIWYFVLNWVFIYVLILCKLCLLSWECHRKQDWISSLKSCPPIFLLLPKTKLGLSLLLPSVPSLLAGLRRKIRNFKSGNWWQLYLILYLYIFYFFLNQIDFGNCEQTTTHSSTKLKTTTISPQDSRISALLGRVENCHIQLYLLCFNLSLSCFIFFFLCLFLLLFLFDLYLHLHSYSRLQLFV